MKMTSPRLLALALALAIAPPLSAQSVTPVDRIAAVVNEDVILQSELARATANVMQQYAGRQGELPPRDVLERQILERLVLQRLQVSRARQAGITASDEDVDQAIASIGEGNKMSPADMRAQLERDGQSWEVFRNNIRDEILTQKLRQAYAQSSIRITEAEVDAALKAQAGAATGKQLHLANIVVALPAGATPEQIAEGQRKIEGIKAQIDAGSIDFTAAAIRFSNGPNALEGGDLGWRSLAEIPPAFASQVGSMQPGQVIGPIRGTTGFQLLKLVEVREGSNAATVTQYQTRRILVKSADAANDTAAKARAETLRARLNGGADFQKLAREQSDDATTKAQGGDAGWRTADALGVDVAQALAGLSDGQVSAPVPTADGWVLVQRVATRQSVAASDEQRAAVRETIGRRKLEDAYDRFLRELRGEAYVDIRTGDVAPVTTPPKG